MTGPSPAPEDPAEGPRKYSLLFVSCDVIGSTALKQSKGVRRWEEILLSFYIDFPWLLGDVGAEDGVSFTLWKPIGDELVFKVEIEREADVYKAVRSWLRAVEKYETSFKERVGTTLKGGAFIATFPSPDVEASVVRDPRTTLPTAPDLANINDEALDKRDHATHVFDYFGPSFDTGFRVIGHSTPRHFTLSAEVAWAMLRAAEDHVGDGHPLEDLVFLGGRELKGVWGGRDYPLFAIDREHRDPINAAMKTLSRQHDFEINDAKALLKACVLSTDLQTSLYLPLSSLEPLQREPGDALAKLRKSGTAVAEGIDEATSAADEAVGVQPQSGEDGPQFALGDRLLTLAQISEQFGIQPAKRPASMPNLPEWAEGLSFPEPDDHVELDGRETPVWLASTIMDFLIEVRDAGSGSDAGEGPGA